MNVNTQFRGQDAGRIIGSIILQSDLLSKDIISVQDSVGSDIVHVRLTEVEGAFANYTPNFVGGGEVNLTEVAIPLKKLTSQLSYNIEDLKQRWGAEALTGRVGNHDASDEAEMIMLEYTKILSNNFGRILLYGEATNAGEFDGFITQIPAARKLTHDMVTPEDVKDALYFALDNTAKEVKKREDFVILVSGDVLDMYARHKENVYFQQDELKIGKYVIQTSDDLEEGTIMTFYKENLYLGCDLTSASNEITIADMRAVGEHVMRLRADSKYGAGIIKPNYMTLVTKA